MRTYPLSRLADTKKEKGRFTQAQLLRPHEGIKNLRGQESSPCAGQSLCSLQFHTPPPLSNILCVINCWSLWNISTELFCPLDFGWVHPEGSTSKKEEDREKKNGICSFSYFSGGFYFSAQGHVSCPAVFLCVTALILSGFFCKTPSKWKFRQSCIGFPLISPRVFCYVFWFHFTMSIPSLALFTCTQLSLSL